VIKPVSYCTSTSTEVPTLLAMVFIRFTFWIQSVDYGQVSRTACKMPQTVSIFEKRKLTLSKTGYINSNVTLYMRHDSAIEWVIITDCHYSGGHKHDLCVKIDVSKFNTAEWQFLLLTVMNWS
jgi:hypothetical protein